MQHKLTILLAGSLAVAGMAQVRVDLANQGKNFDFSGAPFTRPVKIGTTLPATCLQGELFYRTNMAPGTNLYGCTSPNVWTLETGGGASALTFDSSDGSIAPAVMGGQVDLVVNSSMVASTTGNTDLAGANKFGMGATGFLSITVPNEGSTGTIGNRLAIVSGTARTALTTSQEGVVGVVVSGEGTSGNARIAVLGMAACDFDGATVAGHYVQASTVTEGKCHDAGATRPSSGQVLGLVTSTNAVEGTEVFLLLPL